MSQCRNAEPGLIDGLTSDLGGPRTRDLLERLDAAVPWDRLIKFVSALPVYQIESRRGPSGVAAGDHAAVPAAPRTRSRVLDPVLSPGLLGSTVRRILRRLPQKLAFPPRNSPSVPPPTQTP